MAIAYNLIQQKETRNIFLIGTKMGKQSSSKAGLEVLCFISMKNYFSDPCFYQNSGVITDIRAIIVMRKIMHMSNNSDFSDLPISLCSPLFLYFIYVLCFCGLSIAYKLFWYEWYSIWM